MTSNETAEQALSLLLEAERDKTCGEESRQNYFEMHRERFQDILRLCREQVPDSSARVLDIGRSELTAYLLNYYQNVHTMGLDTSVDDGGHREVNAMDNVPHITFDLLSSPIVSSWPDSGRFDLIVFSEVIEHLWVAPEFVFAALRSLLTDKGVLICTTPNATDIVKRVRLALGRNPYERLRLYASNPGHVREYTQKELFEIARSVGLSCTRHLYFNWPQSKGRSQLKALIMKLVRAWPSFRSFQLCVLARTNTSPADR